MYLSISYINICKFEQEQKMKKGLRWSGG